MLGRSGIGGDHQQLKHSTHEQSHINFASVPPSKHPLDLSSRNRNLSLNDLAPSPGRGSKLKESVRGQSSEHGGKQVRKLRIRVEQLEDENMTLHKLIIEYEQEMKDWQEKATRLNQELINYENKELESRFTVSPYQQLAPTVNEHELREFKAANALLEQTNRLHTRKISDLSSQLQVNRRELSRSNEMEMLFHRLQADFQDAQHRLEREQTKNKQNEDYIQDLQKQLQFMSRDIPLKISYMEKEKEDMSERTKKQFSEEMQKIERELSEAKRRLQEQSSQRQNLQHQNRDLRLEIERLLESKSKSSTEMQDLYEEVLRLKQKGYENNKNSEEEVIRREKQQTSKIASLTYENNNLKAENERLSNTISQKIVQIQSLERSIKSINESARKISKIEQQKIIAKSQIFKETRQKVSTYREQIKKLNLQNEQMAKQMKEVQAFYLLQMNNVREEGKKHTDGLQSRINDMKAIHQREKEELIRGQQSSQSQISQLQRIIHEQECHIESLHTKYCVEYDKVMAENASLRRGIQQAESYRLQERQQSEIKIKEYKQYTYTASKLKGEIEQLTFELNQQRSIALQNQQQRVFYQQQGQIANVRAAEMVRKIKDYEMEIQTLLVENQRWKAYRLSEEDEARRQTRRYKKKVEQLQLLLQKEAESNAIGDLQYFQKTIEALKQEMLQQELESARLLEVQRTRLNQAMDEMTKEMHSILRECDDKITQKQSQIILLQNKATELMAINEQLKSLQIKNFANHQQAEQLNDKLQKQLLSARNDAVRFQTMLKKQESENLAMKYSSDAQKQIRTRYDKDMESKVMEIQKLKLQTAELSDELQRKNIASKKQIQALEIALKSREDQVKEAQQRNNYLQSMIETYKAENKRFKQMGEKEKSDKLALQNKIDQLTGQLNAESFKLNKLKEEKSQEFQQYQCEAREWKQKWEITVKENRKLQSRLSEISREHENKESQFSQIQRQLTKNKSQLQDAKQKCEWLQERLNQSSREGSQLKNIKESVVQLEEKEANYQSVIDSQKQKIQVLTKDQSEKFREIQILLSKIDKTEANLKILSTQLEQADRIKAKRLECYQSICNLHLTSCTSSRLTFDDDEQLFLKIVLEYLKTFSSRLSQAIEELGKQKRIILELNQQKENLNGKYQKYKAVALDYKNRKQAQKELVRNNYRFNEQILHHCQNIIRGDSKR